MRGTTRNLSIALGALLMAGAPASAGNFSGNDYADPGGYLFLGGLTAWDNFDIGVLNLPGGIPQTPKFDTSFGFSIKGGYRFMPFLAAEIEGNFLSGWDTTVLLQERTAPMRVFPGDLTVEGGNITGNLLAYLPFGRIQPYALFGIGGTWMNLRTSYPVTTVCGPSWYWGWWCTGAYARLKDAGGFLIKGGGGLDLAISEDWAIVTEATYVKPFGDLSDFGYINLNWGIRFKF